MSAGDAIFCAAPWMSLLRVYNLYLLLALGAEALPPRNFPLIPRI